MSEKEITERNIIYYIKKGNKIKIFGKEFVKNNKNICKMIIDNKKYKIKERYNIKSKKINKLKIKLEGINNVTNMSGMFSGST